MELFKANRQWAERPDDERFSSLEQMLAACKDYFKSAAESRAAWGDFRCEADAGEVYLVGKEQQRAAFTHYAFGQLCQRIEAPASYLRELPATLAVQNLNHGLAKRGEQGTAQMLFHGRNGSLVLRAATSDRYERVWNWEVLERMLGLEAQGWRVPPARPAREGQKGARPATEADVLQDRDGGGGLSIEVGDLIAPAGLYASDHDMFVFLVNEQRRIEDGSEGGLSRGFFVENSEVGDSSLRVTRFLYRHVCGNHIVWGAKGVTELSIRHVGNPRARFAAMEAQLKRYSDASASDEEAIIAKARSFRLGATKEEVLERLFKKERVATKKALEQGLEAIRAEQDGDPLSAWAVVNGLTRASQASPYADQRTELDRAAGEVLQIAF